jgi:hypothetical protein
MKAVKLFVLVVIFMQGSLVYSGDKPVFNMVTADTLRPPRAVIYIGNTLTHMTFYPQDKFQSVDVARYTILKIPVIVKSGNLPAELAFKIKSGESGDYATICTKTFDISKKIDTLTIDFRSNYSSGFKLDWKVKKVEAFTLQNPCYRGGINIQNDSLAYDFGELFFLRPVGSTTDYNIKPMHR